MKVLVLLFFIIPVISLGQNISIDFENNDLSDWYQNNSGHWTTTRDNPIEGCFSLKHNYNSYEASTEWIALFHDPLEIREGAVLQFSLSYDFDPSEKNNWAVILSENSLPGKELTDAFVFGVNYTGNSDELQLWNVKDGVAVSILNTGFDWEENLENGEAVKIRLNFSNTGVVKIETETPGNSFHTIGSAQVELLETANIFTLYYKYTSTYDRGLMFDELTMDGFFSDETTLPFVESISVVSPHEVEVIFSEVVQMHDNLEFCADGAGCYSTGYYVGRSVLIHLPGRLIPGNRYQLSLPDIKDMYGNSMKDEERSQEFYYAKAYDLIINEILADPSPPVLLPETEYIELFNRSEEDIAAGGWHITANNRVTEFPFKVIPSHSYAVLCDADKEALFDTSVYTIPCHNFPKLNNVGSKLILQDRSGRLIHATEYKADWFESSSKKEGGWSLEMINPEDPCAACGNWKESLHYKGGTPGQKNSVFQFYTKNDYPEVWRAAVTESGSVMLYFSEPLDSMKSVSTQFFTVDKGIGNPDSIVPAWPVLEKMEMIFDQKLVNNTIYEISLTSDLCDCSGATLDHNTDIRFTVPKKADSAAIVINEIMFDPEYGYTEYIELYNCSDKTIDIRNYSIIIGNAGGDTLCMTDEFFPVESDSYVIVARHYSGIDNSEPFSRAEHLVCMENMPALPNEGAKIYLFTDENRIYDIVYYSADFHHKLLSETRGVALERISSVRSGLDPGNWQSASSSSGYQTPAAPNSQGEKNDYGCKIEISPESITPNGDGLDDELLIHYTMDRSGYMARVMVFDKNGRKINTLANGEILGTQGYYYYNGKNSDGSDLRTGYYIIFFDAYNDKGSRITEKKSFVIVGTRK
ncbi:MAG: lamin tail domain-containing protein [Bacteroidales bacterium]|nr:lamin tail domain-containing protein [Bacteroidales bacterium]